VLVIPNEDTIKSNGRTGYSYKLETQRSVDQHTYN
jgi:hypothetical protein